MIEEAAGGLTGTGGCIRLVGVGGGEVDVEGWRGSGEVIVHRPGSHVFFTAVQFLSQFHYKLCGKK